MTDGPGDARDSAGWLGRLGRGLARTSEKLGGGLTELFNRRKLDDEAVEELEELLITADLGVTTAAKLAAGLAENRFGKDVDPVEIRTALAEAIATILEPVARPIAINRELRPHVILVCGVNGSGKTTTIGKLGSQFQRDGLEVMLAAGDTFRAAAIEQLEIWGQRIGAHVVTRPTGSDAAGLAYEAVERARDQRADVLMIDTAGRLQNRADLMAELEKIVRVVRKVDDRAPHDSLLVLDATVGQNAHSQVETFRSRVNITGLVLTKLDGSAKGGVVVGLADRFGLPVHAIGIGEGVDDLRPFGARSFARHLVGLGD